MKGINVIVYEAVMKYEDSYSSRVTSGLMEYKVSAEVIFANRVTDDLSDVIDKVYARD